MLKRKWPLTPELRSSLAYAAGQGTSSVITRLLNRLLERHEGHTVRTYAPASPDVLFAFECEECPMSQTLVTFGYTQPATLSKDKVIR